MVLSCEFPPLTRLGGALSHLPITPGGSATHRSKRVQAETGNFAGSAAPQKIAPNPPSNFASFTDGHSGGWDNATLSAGYAARHQLFQSEYHPRCLAAHPTDSFVCDTLDTLYKFIQTPLFVVQNQFDKYAINKVEGMPIEEPFDDAQQA